MTREQQLLSCKKCNNRQLDPQSGLVCKLTGRQADFEGECPDLDPDPNVPEVPDDDETPISAGGVSPEIYEKLRMEQSPMGIIAGIAAGVICAILWAVVTVATGYQIGYMAVAVGAVVGLAMRKVGKYLDTRYSFIGAGVALLSCLLGNFLSVMAFGAKELDADFFELLVQFDYSYLPQMMKETFSPIDLLFYGIAVSEGYKLSIRKITAKDIAAFDRG